MIKISRFPVLIFIVFLFSGCYDNDGNAPVTGDGLLVHLEKALNGVFYEWTDLSYDKDQRLKLIEIQFEGSLQQTYEVTYDGSEPSTLTHIVENTNVGNPIVVDYDVIQQDDEIVLRTGDGVDKYVYRVTKGYIDYCKAYFGPNNNYLNETIFTRGTNNNIEQVAYLVTDDNSTGLKVFEYTFSDHASTFDLPAAYNPVLDFSFTGFDAHLGALMGWKISHQPPLKSSYWDAGGTFRAEKITATPVVGNRVLQKLLYKDEGTGNDNYLLKLSYN